MSKEIEIQSHSSSNLHSIFTQEYLRIYNQEELKAYFQLYENIGIALNDTQKDKIIYYCGGHPYLLAFLGFEIVEMFKSNQPINDIDLIFGKIRLIVIGYYEQLIDLLKEDKTFEKMYQLLFGPIITATDEDILELRDTYGLLEDINLPDDDKALRAFSQHFQEYLQNLGKDIDFWTLWTTLETSLRSLITTVFQEKHKDSWLDVLKSRHALIFQKAEETRIKAKEDYKSDSLLDYLDAQPIFEIVCSSKNWNDFKDIFGGDKAKADFEKKMQLIIKIRNPYAHSRFRSINSTTVQQAEIYCKEILAKISEGKS